MNLMKVLMILSVFSIGVHAESWTSRGDVERTARELSARCKRLSLASGRVPALSALVREVDAFGKKVEDLQSGAGFKAYDRLLPDFIALDGEFKQLTQDFQTLEKSGKLELFVRDAWLTTALGYQYLWHAMTSGLSFEQIGG